MSRTPVVTFFGGVVPAGPAEKELAFEAGRWLGHAGFRLQHGGYNGLMEEAARGAASVGADVVAITLSGKEEWGPFNPYVTNSVHSPNMGARITRLLDNADVVVGMGGGVGSLHELTAALWYAGNIRSVPVLFLGPTACRLLHFLRQERWIYESPTRPLDFVRTAETVEELQQLLPELTARVADRAAVPPDLAERIRRTAFLPGPYQLADGRVLSTYFDPYRLVSDPVLSADIASTMARQVASAPDVVVGVALGGVPLAANLARTLDCPLLIARPRPKPYGTFAQLEGAVKDGQRAVLVDDAVRTGRQMLSALTLLEEADMTVTEAVCVVNRTQDGLDRLRERNVRLHAVLTELDGSSADGSS